MSATRRQPALDPTERKKVMQRLTKPPERVSEAEFIKKSKDFTCVCW